MKILYAVIFGAALCGCASKKNLYDWGGYDGMLYQSYKCPEKAEAIRLQLEQHVSAVETAKQKVAPGLYADLGTMYLQAGDRQKAVLYFGRERDNWPESVALMTGMMRTVNGAKKPEGNL
jgi:hypothetical protein